MVYQMIKFSKKSNLPFIHIDDHEMQTPHNIYQTTHPLYK